MNSAASTLEQFFKKELMKQGIKALSVKLDLSTIETAFNDTRKVSDHDTATIEGIMYDSERTLLEKAELLRNAYLRIVTQPAARNMIIRNLAQLLFAKPEWFAKNKKLASEIFPDTKFDDAFFIKQEEVAQTFINENPVDEE